MKKMIEENSMVLFSVFEKSTIHELSTIQGGEEPVTHTAPENTTCPTGDPDANSSDGDAPAPVESI